MLPRQHVHLRSPLGLSSTMAEQAEAPDGERVLRAVMSHVRSMLARGFDSSEPDLSPTLRLVVCRLAAMSAQAATLARLACLSRATRKVAAALRLHAARGMPAFLHCGKLSPLRATRDISRRLRSRRRRCILLGVLHRGNRRLKPHLLASTSTCRACARLLFKHACWPIGWPGLTASGDTSSAAHGATRATTPTAAWS